VGDVLAALSGLDAARGTLQEAARLLEDLEVAQPPGVAAVQVMTIHKAKGLGFDVVFLPEISDDQIPNRIYFRTARGADWVTEVPASWARQFVPELVAKENEWAAQQRYEGFCLLYVALTRAKRGLYVFLDPPPASRKNSGEWCSLANWMATSGGADGAPGVVFQAGDGDWVESVGRTAPKPAAGEEPRLGPAVVRRERISPSPPRSSSNG
jgi:ATP-dependent exoDNAse (exonuclease V) beta subunit